MKIINLTPHTVTIVDSEGKLDFEIPASGMVARVSSETVNVGYLFDLIPITETVFGEVEGLPDPDGNYYVVSRMVAERVPNRKDVLIPNESVRDSNGVIIGCRSLAHV